MEDKEKHNKPDAIVTLALDRWKKSSDFESEKRTLALEDLKFTVLGEQWTAEAQKLRANRPMLTENRLPTFIAQVVGDQRQNRPQIKVRPVDSKSDPAVASVFTGLIRNIENNSQAGAIRDHAFKQAVTCGWGYYGLMTRYCDEMSFDQEIYHRFIPNQFSVYDDPHAKLPDRSDRKFLVITDKLSKSEFAARYPKAKSDGFATGTGDLDWFGENEVRIGEYWYIEAEKVKIALLSNGETMRSDDKEKWVEGQGADGQPITIVKERTTEINKVYSCIISGHEVLDGPKEWAGKFIPFIYVVGKEDNIEGKTYTTSLVRWAKDPQRMHNYWLSATTEIIALQPKAPFMATPEQIQGHEEMWTMANTANLPYLLYNNVGGMGAPQRMAVSLMPQGAFTMTQTSIEGIKATMGLFDASLGAKGNETSGKAIIARQREGDVANFEFVDNFSKRSLPLEGRMLVDLIPKIYDTAQIIRIINPDDSEKFVMVNQEITDPKKYGVDKKAQEGTIYDLSVGKYDVVVETGPSYSTQRAEAAENLVNIVQAAPQLMQVAGDLLFKNLDWPGAQEVSSRLRKSLPPGMVEPEEGEEQPKPPQPSPQEQLEMQKLALEGEKLNVEKFKLSMEGEEQVKMMRQVALDTFQEVFSEDKNMGGMMGGR